jgi:DNA gyrase inhibitor GyrI
MKKWIIVPIALFPVVLLATYILVPAKINLSQSVSINCTHGAANRYLVNDSNWAKWWPQNTTLPFRYKEYIFQPNQRMFDAIEVGIAGEDITINSRIILIPQFKDSVNIQWLLEYKTGNNPFTRVNRYRQAEKLSRHLNSILTQLKMFLEKPEKVYGITVNKTIVKDTLLISTKKVFTAHPSTQDIYNLINKLKMYIQQQGARETGYPMLNIQQKSGGHYETMVAIPVNKVIKQQNDMVQKNLVQGNILVAEVRGGEHTVNNAFSQMENYLTDHHYESPAIPFYSLVTNRLTETDTTKWITRIYYPVF